MPDEYLRFDEWLDGNKCAIQVHGDGCNQEAIKDRDFLVVDINKKSKAGDLVIAKDIKGNLFLFRQLDGGAMNVLGVVVGVVRKDDSCKD